MSLFNKKHEGNNNINDDVAYINIICNHFYSEMNKLRTQVENNSNKTTLFFKKQPHSNDISSSKILQQIISLTQTLQDKNAQMDNTNIRAGSYIAYLIHKKKEYQAVIFVEDKNAKLYLLDNFDVSLLDNKIEIKLLYLIRTKHNFTNIESLNNAIISDVSIAKNYFFNQKYNRTI